MRIKERGRRKEKVHEFDKLHISQKINAAQ